MDNGFGLSHEQRNWMPALVLPIQIVTTVLLWIRLIARFRRTGGQFGLDDVFIAVAWILGTGVSAAVLLGTLCRQSPLITTYANTGTYRYGFNRHIWDVPENLWSKDALVLDPCSRRFVENELTMFPGWVYRRSFVPVQHMLN